MRNAGAEAHTGSLQKVLEPPGYQSGKIYAPPEGILPGSSDCQMKLQGGKFEGEKQTQQ